MAEPVSPGRRVDWLELFYDLVFVVVIKQLTDLLHGDPALGDFADVVLLFAIVWFAWLNVTNFVNISGQVGTARRIAVLVSMAGVGLIAVAIPDAVGSSALLFVIGYAVARIAIWPLWIAVNRGTGRGWIRATIFGPGIAALWIASAFVPESARPWVWLALVIGEIVFLATVFTGVTLQVSHLLERVGLFVMIVLGESVVELILAVHADQSALAWVVSTGAFVLVCAIWWRHFEFVAPVAERVVGHRSGGVLRDVVVIAHFFFLLGLIGIAAGLGSAIEHADDTHLPLGATIALGAGLGSYHLANVIVAGRYGARTSGVVLIAAVGVAAVTMFVLVGAGAPAWVLLLIAFAYMIVDRLTIELVARRLAEPTFRRAPLFVGDRDH
jgi:low temperature requirement protein LtrA